MLFLLIHIVIISLTSRFFSFTYQYGHRIVKNRQRKSGRFVIANIPRILVIKHTFVKFGRYTYWSIATRRQGRYFHTNEGRWPCE